MKPKLITIESLREAIKPQIEAVKTWEKSLSNLREALRKYEEEFDTAQARLTEMVNKIQEALASGKNARTLEENSFVVKQNRDHLSELIAGMQEKSIPSGEENLRLAQVQLRDTILANLTELKAEYRKQLVNQFEEIGTTWLEFTTFFDDLRKSLGVQLMSWEIDSLRTIPTFSIPASLRGYIGNLST